MKIFEIITLEIAKRERERERDASKIANNTAASTVGEEGGGGSHNEAFLFRK